MSGIPDMNAFDATLPLERARTIPNDWYTDPKIAELERKAIFGASWQAIGPAEKVSRPGGVLTADVAGEPVLAVRGADGVLRGFFNVCRHRAAALHETLFGQVEKLRCQYHGWTYDLSGKLRGTPEFDGVCEFAKEDNGLVPLGGIAEWGNVIWVHLDPPGEPLEQFLAPLPTWATQRNPYANLKFAERRSYTIACNWKVYVDNYLDGGYHVNTVHPALAGVLDYKEYKTELFANSSLQSSPLKPAEGSAGATRTGDLAAYWWIWPNFMVNYYSGLMDTNVVLPIAPDKCRVIFDFYFTDATPEKFMRDSIEVAQQVQDEDIGVCEQVQRGLTSRSYRTGRFSVKREAGGYHFQQMLGRRLNSASANGV